MKQLATLISALFFLVIGVSQVWALPNCEGSLIASNWNNCFGTYIFGMNAGWAGDRYVGEFKDGSFHGQGTYTYANGNKYVGEFKDGKRHGQGTYTHANGNKKEGVFKDDQFLYAQKKSKIDKLKDICQEIGYTPKTEMFADCVLEFMKKD